MGDFFAFEKSKVKPDIVPIAKGIGGGFPIGAVLMNKKVACRNDSRNSWFNFWRKSFSNGCWKYSYGYSFKKKFLKNVKKNSKYFFSKLNNLKKKYPNVIKEIRGRGFLIGITTL